MSHSHLRKDKNCLNCYNPNVEERFCPKCGQENIENRMSLKGIIFHFFEDLTHYDSAFFKSIKYLLFNPAKLTLAYLDGRRKIYVAPIKLYFFISFITFFLPSVLPDLYQQKKEPIATEKKELNPKVPIFGLTEYKTVKQYDSVQKALPEHNKINSIRFYLTRKVLETKEKKSAEYIKERFNEDYQKNIPKAIFIYLPIFGFWLWLFHSKKRWFFFDHAIFTFHYFSFLLLTLTISITFIERLISAIPSGFWFDNLSNINGFITLGWIFVYFYIANKRMYREKRWLSFLKSTLLLAINLFFIGIVMFILAIYSIVTIH